MQSILGSQRSLFSLFLLLILTVSAAFARPGGHDHVEIDPKPAKVQFIENQGQWEPHIRYMAHIPGGKLFVEANQLTFIVADLHNLHDDFFHKVGEERSERVIPIKGHAFQIQFPNANAHPQIMGGDKYLEYHNYFVGDDPSKWQGNVPIYATLRVKDLWPGIDLILYGKEGSVKYDFVLHPGSNSSMVKMRYEGLDEVQKNTDGSLTLPTNIGKIKDEAPVSTLKRQGTNITTETQFVVSGNEVSFQFLDPYYRHDIGWTDLKISGNDQLVIDPSLIFGSYTGSTSDNFGYTATYDTAGNLYGGGIAFGLGYPTTLGAFQVAYGGGSPSPFGAGFDISISKFNPLGTALVWSTFLGGTGNEQPHSLITNDAGELMVYGRTNSTNFPTTGGAFQTVLSGMDDIIVTKFNATGTALIGSTYLGGTGNDGLNITTSFTPTSLYQNYGDDARGEIMIDATGNIYIASCTQSNNFPTTAGSLQTAFGGGTQDGVVCKFNATLTNLIWSTYLGGSGNDAAYSVKIGAGNEPYVAGGTESPNFPTTAGTINTTYRGAIDGFITRLNSFGSAIVASTFIGTSAYDQCYFLELDQSGDVFVVGQSRGTFPVTAGTYNIANSGQFVAKYNPALTATFFSTVFGTGGNTTNISPTAFLVDRCGFIYVSGWGGTVNFSGNTNGLPTTPGAFQTTTNGSDMYLIVLQPDAVGLEYATFYGGATSSEHVDGGTSRFDRNLVVYQAVCAGCGSNDDFPTTVGAVSQTNNSTNCNLGVFKFAFDAQDVLASYTATAIDSCAPFPVNFTNNSQGGLQYLWSFGDGSPNVTTFNASHIYTIPGTYTVILVATDSNSCNFSDTAVTTVTVYANPFVVINQADTACAGSDVQLTAFGGQFYDWSPGANLSDSTIANPIANPTQNTQYTVIVSDTNGCVDTGYVNVVVTFFEAEAGPPTSFCEGTGGAQLQAGAVSGGLAPYYYIWWCDSTNTFCGLDSMYDDNPMANPTVTTWYFLQVQDSRGCFSNVDSALVEVLPVPIANAGPDQYICQQPAPGALLNGSISGAPGPYTISWINSTGLNDSTLLNPYARPDTTTIYTLVAIAGNGCSSSPTTVDTLSTAIVHVQPRPIADAGPDLHTCFTDSLMIQGQGYGAGPDYDFEWSPSTGLSNDAITNPIAAPPSTHIYTLVVWSNGCPSFGDTMTFWVHTLPTPSPGNIVEICLGDSGQLDAFGAGDSSATYTYVWNPPTGLNDPTAENPLASPDTSTWYTLEVTSSWGCKSPLDSVLLRVKPTPFAEAGSNQLICGGDSLTLQGSYFYTSTDSAPPLEIYYSWSPGATVSDTTMAQPLAWPSTPTIYYLDVTYNTCHTRDSVLITLIPGLGATAVADTSVICAGDSVRLVATSGSTAATIQWVPSGLVSDPNSFVTMASVSDTTVITAFVSQGGCTETVSFEVAAIPRPEAEFSASTPQGCPPHPMSFLNLSDGATAYVWSFGDGSDVSNALDASHVYASPGEYTVQLVAITAGACADTAQTLTVHVGDTAIVDFTSNPDYPITLSMPGSEVIFSNLSRNAIDYRWDFGDGVFSSEQHPTHFFQTPGTYYVTLMARSVEDCPGRVVHGPYVILSPELFIPNVFSPNADGLNDLFRPEYTGNQPVVYTVFDRWGNVMYNSTNKMEGWDGNTAKGQPAPEGVYFYQVQFGDQGYAGEVTLLR